MSYDFELFHGSDTGEASRNIQRGDPQPAFPKQSVSSNRHLADLLVKQCKGLRIFEPASQTFADNRLELNDDKYGMQIVLFAGEGAITIPIGHEDDVAKKALLKVWACLRILQSGGRFGIRDAQLGRNIVLERDFDAVLSNYRKCTDAFKKAIHPR